MIRPTRLRLEAASVCQLRCPACPTTHGEIRRSIGGGFLAFESFRHLIDANPHVAEVELSNWGEIFLNRELLEIMQYAFRHGVALRAENGVNLNTVSEDVLEGLVRYKFRILNCSIDGATPATYAIYRKRGDFDQVIRNLRRINAYKQRYRSVYPHLVWQFVAFSHNEHEIDAARALASQLDMGFWVKLSWDAEHTTPATDAARMRRETGAADMAEYRETFGKPYFRDVICGQLWTQPQVHSDGKVLGCCVNYWGDFGNAITDGLDTVLNGERMGYARRMLEGEVAARDDIPCTRCGIYEDMRRAGAWVDGDAMRAGGGRWWRRSRLANRAINRFVNRPVYGVLAAVIRRLPEGATGTPVAAP